MSIKRNICWLIKVKTPSTLFNLNEFPFMVLKNSSIKKYFNSLLLTTCSKTIHYGWVLLKLEFYRFDSIELTLIFVVVDFSPSVMKLVIQQTVHLYATFPLIYFLCARNWRLFEVQLAKVNALLNDTPDDYIARNLQTTIIYIHF